MRHELFELRERCKNLRETVDAYREKEDMDLKLAAPKLLMNYKRLAALLAHEVQNIEALIDLAEGDPSE